MLKNNSRKEYEIHQGDRNIEIDLELNEIHQKLNLIGEDFRSLLNTFSRGNREVTVETERKMNNEKSLNCLMSKSRPKFKNLTCYKLSNR